MRSSLRTTDVFPVVASLPEEEKRRPEIRLLFAGYKGSSQTSSNQIIHKMIRKWSRESRIWELLAQRTNWKSSFIFEPYISVVSNFLRTGYHRRPKRNWRQCLHKIWGVKQRLWIVRERNAINVELGIMLCNIVDKTWKFECPSSQPRMSLYNFQNSKVFKGISFCISFNAV